MPVEGFTLRTTDFFIKEKVFSVFKYLKFLHNNALQTNTNIQTLPIFGECPGLESGLLSVQGRRVSRRTTNCILQPN